MHINRGTSKETQHQLKINDELLKQNKVLMQKLLNNHLYTTYVNVSSELGVKELKDIKSEYSKLKIELEESNIELKHVNMEIDNYKNKVGDLKLADVKNDIKTSRKKVKRYRMELIYTLRGLLNILDMRKLEKRF